MVARITSILAFLTTLAVFGISLAIVLLARVSRGMRPGRTRRQPGRLQLLLTGTFYNENWIRAHLIPLARADAIGEIDLVVDKVWFDVPKVNYICPPGWMRRWLGRSGSRVLLVFLTAFKRRPDWLIGYHIMPNALACLVAGALFGGKTGFQLTGGPVQIVGGGVYGANSLLSKIGHESALLQSLLFSLVKHFNVIVVRGSRARDFIHDEKLGEHSLIITGSVDTDGVLPVEQQHDCDLVCVSRLIKTKNVDYLVRIVAAMAKEEPNVLVRIIGDGPERPNLHKLAEDLEIADKVVFHGHIDDVGRYLSKAKMFILPSATEGMSIAILEAMSYGLPVACMPIGDLPDAVIDNKTGLLLDQNNPQAAAAKLLAALRDDPSLQEMGAAARNRVVQQFSIGAITQRWDGFFRGRSLDPVNPRERSSVSRNLRRERRKEFVVPKVKE